MRTEKKLLRRIMKAVVISAVLLFLQAGTNFILARSGADSGELSKTFIRKYKMANDQFKKYKKYFANKDFSKAGCLTPQIFQSDITRQRTCSMLR